MTDTEQPERYAVAYQKCNNSSSCYCNKGWTIMTHDYEDKPFETAYDAYMAYEDAFHGEHKHIFVYRIGYEPSFITETTRKDSVYG